MEPINARERRIQFFRFVLLFLLAVVPIATVVYLFGRVDHVENEFLRSAYEGRRSSSAESAGRTTLFAELTTKAGAFNDLVTTSSSEMLKFHEGTNRSGEFRGELEKLGNAVEDLNKQLGTAATDSVYLAFVGMVRSFKASSAQFSEVYNEACLKLEALEVAKANETKELLKFRSAFKACNAKLDAGDKVDPELQ